MVSTRRAVLQDAPILQDLTEQLGYQISLDSLEKHIAVYLDDVDRELLVAEREGIHRGIYRFGHRPDVSPGRQSAASGKSCCR